jgi:hypothetical protein
MAQNIGYHTRLYKDNTVKVCGGSFGGSIDGDTVERLVNAMFTVKVLQSGTPVFVDREGREVRLYLSVDADKTNKGALALQNYRIERDRLEQERQAQSEREQNEIDQLMADLTHDEIIKRLKGES